MAQGAFGFDDQGDSGEVAEEERVAREILETNDAFLASCPAYRQIAWRCRLAMVTDVMRWRFVQGYDIPEYKRKNGSLKHYEGVTLIAKVFVGMPALKSFDTDPRTWQPCPECRGEDGISTGRGKETAWCPTCGIKGYVESPTAPVEMPGKWRV